MKAFIVAMLILTVMIGGAYYYVRWLNNTVDELNESLRAMDVYVFTEDWSSCRITMEGLNDQWVTTYQKLSFFMHHQELDAVNQTVYELNRCIEIKNKDLFLVRNKKLQELLMRLPTGEKLCVENIL